MVNIINSTIIEIKDMAGYHSPLTENASASSIESLGEHFENIRIHCLSEIQHIILTKICPIQPMTWLSLQQFLFFAHYSIAKTR